MTRSWPRHSSAVRPRNCGRSLPCPGIPSNATCNDRAPDKTSMIPPSAFGAGLAENDGLRSQSTMMTRLPELARSWASEEAMVAIRKKMMLATRASAVAIIILPSQRSQHQIHQVGAAFFPTLLL
jgi:hypothetical protein